MHSQVSTDWWLGVYSLNTITSASSSASASATSSTRSFWYQRLIEATSRPTLPAIGGGLLVRERRGGSQVQRCRRRLRWRRSPGRACRRHSGHDHHDDDRDREVRGQGVCGSEEPCARPPERLGGGDHSGDADGEPATEVDERRTHGRGVVGAACRHGGRLGAPQFTFALQFGRAGPSELQRKRVGGSGRFEGSPT